MVAQAPRATEWPANGGDYSNQQFSPSAQISTSIVGHLLLREMVQTGPARFDGLPIRSPTGH
jgi:hypothetical protein